jgi:hypothetical protein
VIPKRLYPLVEVLWDDATELKDWKEEHEEEDLKPCLILSVGFLVKQTKSHVVICQDLSYDGMRNGRSQIPRGMVKQIKVLQKKDADSSTK